MISLMTDEATDKVDEPVTKAPTILTRVGNDANWHPHDYQDGVVLSLESGQVTDEQLDEYFRAGVREVSFTTDDYTYHFKPDVPQPGYSH